MNFIRANKNNWIVFSAPETSITLASLIDEPLNFVDYANALTIPKDNQNRIDQYALPLYSGFTMKYYANFENLSTASDFANWRVALVNNDNYAVVYDNIATLVKDTITGISFRWHFNWTVPALLVGCYRFVVYENSGNTVLYLSKNVFKYTEDAQDFCFIKYRNPVNIQNFNYEGLTTWYNQFYIWLKKRSPKRTVNSIGYDLTEGTFNRVRSVITKEYEFVSDFMDEDTTDAWQAAIVHKTLQIDSGEGLQSYRLSDDSEIEQEFIENYPLAETTVRLELIDYASSNKST